MKVDAAFMPALADAGPAAKKLEDMGCDGLYTFEGPHEPFMSLALAAVATQRVSLYPAIAVAFARNPMLLANIGHDLQRLSGGRFILGLGTQIRPHIEKRYSMPWSRPVARMREMVRAIRAIWQAWEGDGRLDFRGEFYTHTLMTPFFNPGPCPGGSPPIYLAGVGPAMTEMAGAEADGFLVHPLNTAKSLRELTLPALKRGLKSAGRIREQLQVVCPVMLAAGRSEEEQEAGREQARAQIAFYGSTPAYRPVLEVHGWGDLQPELNILSKAGKWKEMGRLVSDEILETIAVVGELTEALARLVRERGFLMERAAPIVYSGDADLMRDTTAELKRIAKRTGACSDTPA